MSTAGSPPDPTPDAAEAREDGPGHDASRPPPPAASMAGAEGKPPGRAAAFATWVSDVWTLGLDSPTWRAIMSLLSTVVVGVLAGAFVAEITDAGILKWGNFYKAPSFWALLVVSAALAAYQRALHARATEVLLFKDNEYCVAYVRAQCLPEAAQRYKTLIRTGRIGELEKAMAEVRRIVK